MRARRGSHGPQVGLSMMEGILEVTTFSKATGYKEFVGWQEGGKEGLSSLKGWETVGYGWSVFL